MAFTHVTDEERTGKGVTGLSDTPGLAASALQQKFDELGNLGIDGLNRFLDEIEKETGASSVGAQVPATLTADKNVQSVINAIAYVLNSAAMKAHQHANKAVLDGISETNKTNYDNLVLIFGAVTALAQVVTNSNTEVPTSKAVEDYIESDSAKTVTVNNVYPVGSIYIGTTDMSPSTRFGGTWEAVDLGISYGHAFKRVS